MSETNKNPSPPPNGSESDPDPSPSSNINPPVAASTTTSTSTNKTPHKRRREYHSNSINSNRAGRQSDEFHQVSKRGRVKSTTTSHNDLIYRIVVPAWQIGKVIGRGGRRVQFIRDQTYATIKIADAISRNEERVIIISSKYGDNVFSDAEKALHQIVNLILLDDGTKDPGQVGAGHVAPNAVRLLIAGSQAGALIGVSGQNIENLRNSSGATITVLSPNQLPPCASAHESDRIAQVSGDVPAVLRAVVEIGCQLRVNPPKQVISVNPAHNVSFHPNYPQHQHYVDLVQHYVDPPLAEHVTLDLMVPENLVGGLIGRFGANISRIRNESGANIKVHGGRGEQTQRKIHLSGNAQQVNLARQRVDEYVHAELMRQSGGQLPQTSGIVQDELMRQSGGQLPQTAGIVQAELMRPSGGQLPQTAGIVQQVNTQPPMLEIPKPPYQAYERPSPYPYPYPYPHPDPHPQAVPHPDGFYANSTYEAGMMVPPPAPPPTYAPAPVQQPPPYYGYQPYPPHYPAPPL